MSTDAQVLRDVIDAIRQDYMSTSEAGSSPSAVVFRVILNARQWRSRPEALSESGLLYSKSALHQRRGFAQSPRTARLPERSRDPDLDHVVRSHCISIILLMQSSGK